MYSFLIGLDKLKKSRVIIPSSEQNQFINQSSEPKLITRTFQTQPIIQPLYTPRKTWSMIIESPSGRCACG